MANVRVSVSIVWLLRTISYIIRLMYIFAISSTPPLQPISKNRFRIHFSNESANLQNIQEYFRLYLPSFVLEVEHHNHSAGFFSFCLAQIAATLQISSLQAKKNYWNLPPGEAKQRQPTYQITIQGVHSRSILSTKVVAYLSYCKENIIWMGHSEGCLMNDLANLKI